MLHSQTTDKQIQQKRIQQGITQQLTNNKQSDSETSNTAGTASSYKWHRHYHFANKKTDRDHLW